MTGRVNPDESALAHRNRADWIVALALPVIFILLTLVTTGENALAVTATVGALAAVVQQKWSSRKDPRMWVLVAVVAAIQIPAVFFIHIPRLSAGLVFLPFVLIEAFALWAVLNWIERRSPPSEPGQPKPGSDLA